MEEKRRKNGKVERKMKEDGMKEGGKDKEE